MRVPIEVSMAWPERIESGVERLDLLKFAGLTFEAPDQKRFPCLTLAWEAMRAPEGATTVLNAANEAAVFSFLNGGLRFDHIYQVVSECLNHVNYVHQTLTSIDDLFALDEETRHYAKHVIAALI